MSRIMLNKRAEHSADRFVITEFLVWLESEHKSFIAINELNVEKLLDEYHGIDRRQLEQERLAILEKMK